MADLMKYLWGDDEGEVPNIDSMENLKKGLRPADVAKVRYAQRGTGKRQPCSKNTVNTMIDKELNEDVLYGVANSERLNPALLGAIIECIPIINWREIQLMLDCSQSLAKKYALAARCALVHLERDNGPKR